MKNICLNGMIKCVAPNGAKYNYILLCYKGSAPMEQETSPIGTKSLYEIWIS